MGAIAINRYLIEKRELDKKLEAEDTKIEVNYRKTYEPYLLEISNIINGLTDLTDQDIEGVDHLLTDIEHQEARKYYLKQKL